MRTVAVLPARFASTRFPGKPLASLLGRPMIQWVVEAARQGGVDRVIVATDDERIRSAVEAFGGEAVMTDPALPSGTDRVAAALATLDETFDVILNIQGDEPGMHAQTLRALLDLMAAQPDLPMGTAACPFDSPEEVFNPNIVKVVVDDRQRALYFSRSPLPYVRSSTDFSLDFRERLTPELMRHFRRHLGVYAFRPEALRTFMATPPHPLEQLEMLEQLRALGMGMPLGVADTPYGSLGVDTPDDVAPAEALLRARFQA